jgi:hypothetical protein
MTTQGAHCSLIDGADFDAFDGVGGSVSSVIANSAAPLDVLFFMFRSFLFRTMTRLGEKMGSLLSIWVDGRNTIS